MSLTDWLPIYREHDWHGPWRLMNPVDFARVLWRRAFEERSKPPKRPGPGILEVQVMVYNPRGLMCFCGSTKHDAVEKK